MGVRASTSAVFAVACDLCFAETEPKQPTELGAKAAASGSGYVSIHLGNDTATGDEIVRWVCSQCANKIHLAVKRMD
jgi:hypothetical protein